MAHNRDPHSFSLRSFPHSRPGFPHAIIQGLSRGELP
jgi:hypothetical protein